MAVRCNMKPERQEEVWPTFRGFLTTDEEDQIRQKFNHYIFYETYGTRDFRECFCSACRSTWEIRKCEDKEFFQQKHGDTVDCPSCGLAVELKALGKYREFSSLRQSVPAVFIRAAKDGEALISAGIAFRQFSFNDLYGWIEWEEKARYSIKPGEAMGWKCWIESPWSCRGMVFGTNGEWQPTKNICKPFKSNPMYGLTDEYWVFGSENLERTQLRYSQIETWYEDSMGQSIDQNHYMSSLIPEYLAEYAMHPQVEMAVKFGLGNMVTEKLEGCANTAHLNWKAKNPAGFLRMTKHDAEVFLKNPSPEMLVFYHGVQGRISMEQAMEIYGSLGERAARQMMAAAKKCNATAEKALRYVQHPQGGMEPREMIQYWNDYLDMASKLSYDMTRQDVTMPKNLIERHDTAAETIAGIEYEKRNKGYAKRRKELQERFCFGMNGFSIIVPESYESIIKEGKTLKHCVGGYAQRHVEGKTTILFLRKERTPGRSLITIEVEGQGANWKIRQAYGYKDDRYKGAVPTTERFSWFFSVWLGWVNAGSQRDKNGNPIILKEEIA